VVFALNYTQVMLIQFTFFAAYFIVSLPLRLHRREGRLQTRHRDWPRGGWNRLPDVLTPPPAPLVPHLPLGPVRPRLGITLLQVSANPYVAILGRPETASSRLTLTQAFNSLGPRWRRSSDRF